MLLSHKCEICSGKSTEDSDKQVKDEELAICASPDNESTLDMQIIKRNKNLLEIDVMLMNYLDCKV